MSKKLPREKWERQRAKGVFPPVRAKGRPMLMALFALPIIFYTGACAWEAWKDGIFFFVPFFLILLLIRNRIRKWPGR